MKVYNLNLDKNIPKNAVYIGRPSSFGNPYSYLSGTLAKYKVKNRREAIDKYREYILDNQVLLEKVKNELKNKDLICFCSPLPCHGDILLEIANKNE